MCNKFNGLPVWAKALILIAIVVLPPLLIGLVAGIVMVGGIVNPIQFITLGYTIGYVMIAVFVVLLLAVLVIFRRSQLKESIRKFLVTVKRNPQAIPLIMMLIAFGIYSFNLTNVSDTTAQLQAKNMGLCQFCIMLFSLLSMVCLLNAFPRRKKPNYPIIGVAFVLFAIQIACAFFYRSGVMSRVRDPQFNIKLSDYPFISKAYNAIGTYMILVVVTAVLVATLPIYSKLLKKIKTSVAVEDNGSMGEIEISE